jgi:hypothetical protein
MIDEVKFLTLVSWALPEGDRVFWFVGRWALGVVWW